MKAQLSLEYLVLSVILLALLGIALVTLVKIKDNADAQYAAIALKNDAETIYNAAQDVCALGDGNSRETTLRGDITVTSSGTTVVFSAKEKGQEFPYKFRCESQLSGTLNGRITIANEGGKIVVKN